MKRAIFIVVSFTLPTLLFLTLGCGKAKTADDSTHKNGETSQTDYELGFSKGLDDGYNQGYADGKKGVHSPEFEVDPESGEDYIAGYGEGFYEGYENGYGNASGGTKDGETPKGGDEVAAVEAAMITFVKNNAVPGLEFKIENIVIHGDEAAGIAVCTSEKLESPLVIMKKSANGWYGVDFGTGIEPPSWYTY